MARRGSFNVERPVPVRWPGASLTTYTHWAVLPQAEPRLDQHWLYAALSEYLRFQVFGGAERNPSSPDFKFSDVPIIPGPLTRSSCLPPAKATLLESTVALTPAGPG